MRARRRRALAVALVALAVATAGAREGGAASPQWGPFRGQFIDVATGRPIPGAVVLVVWLEWEFRMVGVGQKFYAARHAVADAEGRFEVPALEAPLAALSIGKPTVSWFAPGYGHQEVAVTPPDGQRFLDPTVLRMRRRQPGERVTTEERLATRTSIHTFIPAEQHRTVEEQINAERQRLGLPPTTLSGGRFR